MESSKHPITWKDVLDVCHLFKYKVICKFGYCKTADYCFAKIFGKYGIVDLTSFLSLDPDHYKTFICENPKCKEIYGKCPFASFKCINLKRKNECFRKWAIEHHTVKL